MNTSAIALALFLPVDNGRFCATSVAIERAMGSTACTLVAGTRDGQKALARIVVAPHGRARFEGLEVDASEYEERWFPDGTSGFFERPVEPGRAKVQVSIPVSGAQGGHLVAPVSLDVP